MARRFAKVSEEEIVAINCGIFYPSDLVNTKTTIPLRVGEDIYPPLFTSPSGDSCIQYMLCSGVILRFRERLSQ